MATIKPLYVWASAQGASGTPTGSEVTLDINDRVRDSGDVLFNYLSQGNTGLHTTNGAVIQGDFTTGTVFSSNQAWNTVKTFGLISAPSSLNQGSVTTKNFTHSIVRVETDGYALTNESVDVTVEGSKRGEVQTGNGGDHVEWGVFSNGNNTAEVWSEAVKITTNGGDDEVVFRGVSNGVIVTPVNVGPATFSDGHTTLVTVDLGKGADSYTGAGLLASATIKGGQGSDTITGGEGTDHVCGGKDADLISGNGGADTLNGNLGSDTINGGSGSDVIHGGQGSDAISGGTDNGTATVTSTDGVTIASAGWSAGDELYGDLGADSFTFSDGDGVDILKAYNAAQDSLIINTAYDLLFLQVGADTLIGFYDTNTDTAVANQLIVVEGALLDAGDITFAA